MIRPAIPILLLSLVAWAGPSPAAEPTGTLKAESQEFTGSAAYGQLRRSGREVVAERKMDLDGDGRTEVLVLSQAEEWMDLSAFRDLGEGGFELLSRSRKLAASHLAKLQALSLGPRQGVYLDVFEDSPDEADHHILVMVGNPAGLAEVFHTEYREPHSEEEAGRTPRETLDLGRQPLGLTVLDEGKTEDAWPVLVLRHSPKLVLLDEAGTRAVVVGARREVFAATAGRYRRQERAFDTYLDTLPSRCRPIAPDGAPDAGSPPPPVATPAGDLTGLRVGSQVSVRPDQPGPIRAIRVLPGCTDSDAQWLRYGRLRSFGLKLDDRPALLIDRQRPEAADARVLGVVDLALPDRSQARQTVIFLRSPELVTELTLTVREIEAGQESSTGACLGRVELLRQVDPAQGAASTSSASD